MRHGPVLRQETRPILSADNMSHGRRLRQLSPTFEPSQALGLGQRHFEELVDDLAPTAGVGLCSGPGPINGQGRHARRVSLEVATEVVITIEDELLLRSLSLLRASRRRHHHRGSRRDGPARWIIADGASSFFMVTHVW
jgi:hypothetical protein